MITPESGRFSQCRFTHIIGTGGIGSGMFLKLTGNHTLGRNESRPMEIFPWKDYCKLHIILHYLAVLLGNTGFELYPIGKVGTDEAGHALLEEMKAVGMNTESVSAISGANTLYSICFQYPDSSGGNLTTENSASSKVRPEDIDAFFQEHPMLKGGSRELILAVPEVPVQTRIRLLEKGRERGSFTASSVLSSEASEFVYSGGIEKTDLLALNIDEAAAVSGLSGEEASMHIAEECIKKSAGLNPDIMLLISDGSKGSYAYYDGHLQHIPAVPAAVASTAGAGDALLSGTIAGLAKGMPFSIQTADSFSISAVQFGTILASLSVMSADTIHKGADLNTVKAYAAAGKDVLKTLWGISDVQQVLNQILE